MERRFQVFVSSTYEDLKTERQEVIQALLEMDCIPAGMELFPAADESQWEFIKRIINDSDYYVVIVAGRYGSLSPSGVGYTEMEYRYAREIGKPALGFLHKEPDKLPANKTERTDVGQERLSKFRAYVADNKMCKFWTSPAELAGIMSRSLNNQIKQTPAIGWVRGNDIADPVEIVRLKARIDELEHEIESLATTRPKGSEGLAQGSETFALNFNVEGRDANGRWSGSKLFDLEWETILEWAQIFTVCLPPLTQEGSGTKIKLRLNSLLESTGGNDVIESWNHKNPNKNVVKVWASISETSFHSVIVQMQALGLIVESVRKRHVRDSENYWRLTPFGTTTMLQLCAIKSANY